LVENILGQTPDPAKTRHYYIAAEPEQWDFMPSGSDVVCGMPVALSLAANHRAWKARYFQYTDGTFTKRVPQNARLGILGPVLRGTVANILKLLFLNRTRGGAFSMHPHGVKYDKDSEGSYHGNAANYLQSGKDFRPVRAALIRARRGRWVRRPVHLCLVLR